MGLGVMQLQMLPAESIRRQNNGASIMDSWPWFENGDEAWYCDLSGVPASILLLTYPQQDGSPGTADPCHVSIDKGPGWLFYCFNVPWTITNIRYPGSVPLG